MGNSAIYSSFLISQCTIYSVKIELLTHQENIRKLNIANGTVANNDMETYILPLPDLQNIHGNILQEYIKNRVHSERMQRDFLLCVNA